MQVTIDTIASQLPAMSEADLLKVRKLTDMLLQGQPKEIESEDPTERLLFEAVRVELAAVGIRSAMTYAQFSESRFYKSWKRGVEVVRAFIETSFKGYIKNETHHLAVCRVLVQTMVKEFRAREIPLSIGSIANNIHRVPQTFDRAFPRYLESGLAYLVPRALLRNNAA